MLKTVSLTILAVAAASSGWVHALRADGAKPSAVQTLERAASRVLFFGNQTIAAQYSISYGSPTWKDEFEKQASKVPDGKRIRFGKDFWTTLETNVPLTMGDVRLAPNYYYLALERAGDGFNIVAYDAGELRNKRINSFEPPEEGGIVIPTRVEKGDDVEDELMMDFVVDNGSGSTHLEVTWGPYTMTVPVAAHLATE